MLMPDDVAAAAAARFRVKEAPVRRHAVTILRRHRLVQLVKVLDVVTRRGQRPGGRVVPRDLLEEEVRSRDQVSLESADSALVDLNVPRVASRHERREGEEREVPCGCEEVHGTSGKQLHAVAHLVEVAACC